MKKQKKKQLDLFTEGTSRTSDPEEPVAKMGAETVAEALEATGTETLKQLSIRLRNEVIEQRKKKEQKQ